MGGRMSMPEADEKMTKCIKTMKLKPREVAKIYKTFQRYDKAKTGKCGMM
jgi:hypothetical protein